MEVKRYWNRVDRQRPFFCIHPDIIDDRTKKCYSRKVSMEEIEANDFNLNISRYVSTAKPEEEIDLGAVNKELVALEEKVMAATNKHNEFLKELGLPPLP